MSDQSQSLRSLNNSEVWGGLFGIGLSGFVIYSGYDLGLGVINDPGAGFVLFYTGVMMLMFAASILVTGVTKGGPSVGSLWRGLNWQKPCSIIAALIVYSFALEPLGFLIATVPLMLFMLRAIDPVAWPRAVLIAVSAPVIVWWVLKHGLTIMLPTGMFEIG